MDRFWGTTLRKQSIWRGDGGAVPNSAMCSVMQDRGVVVPAKTWSNSICMLPPAPIAWRPSALSPWVLKGSFSW